MGIFDKLKNKRRQQQPMNGNSPFQFGPGQNGGDQQPFMPFPQPFNQPYPQQIEQYPNQFESYSGENQQQLQQFQQFDQPFPQQIGQYPNQFESYSGENQQQLQQFQQFDRPIQEPIQDKTQQYTPQFFQQPQPNAYQQYVQQNRLLQPVPFQDQPVIQPTQNSFQNQEHFQSTQNLMGNPFQQAPIQPMQNPFQSPKMIQQNQFPMTEKRSNSASTPGFLTRLLGGDTSFSGVIGHMQKAVQTAQQVTPMIQQYGPIVRNFPSLYRIFKAVNNDDAANEKKNKTKDTNTKKNSEIKQLSNNQEMNNRSDRKQDEIPSSESSTDNNLRLNKPVKHSSKQQSRPKLFI